MFCRSALENASDSFEYGIIYSMWLRVSGQTIHLIVMWQFLNYIIFPPSVRMMSMHACVVCICWRNIVNCEQLTTALSFVVKMFNLLAEHPKQHIHFHFAVNRFLPFACHYIYQHNGRALVLIPSFCLFSSRSPL